MPPLPQPTSCHLLLSSCLPLFIHREHGDATPEKKRKNRTSLPKHTQAAVAEQRSSRASKAGRACASAASGWLDRLPLFARAPPALALLTSPSIFFFLHPYPARSSNLHSLHHRLIRAPSSSVYCLGDNRSCRQSFRPQILSADSSLFDV